MTTGDQRRAATTTPAPPDPGLVKLVEALAREQARRDHRADLAARRSPLPPEAVEIADEPTPERP